MHGRSRLASLLAEIRQRADLSQEAIGALAGVGRSQVSRWEHGHHQPEYITIRRLAANLHARHPELDDLSGQLVAAAGYEGNSAPPAPPRYEDQALQAIWNLPGLSEEVRRGMIALARGMRQVQDEADAEHHG